MDRLDSNSIAPFLHRFHQGRDGRLLGVEVRTAHGSIGSVTFDLRLRDAEIDDADTDLRLELSEVSELRVQVRPTENPETLADGIAVAAFGGQTFVDLMPWTDPPSGVHDFRLSNCYAAGSALQWGKAEAAG